MRESSRFMSTNLSLKALEAFESAARNGSFVAAAQELSITPAAVSQLIRNLENQVGRKLFHRINRSITLTEAGLEIQPHVSMAFDELNQVAQKLKANTPQRKLVISIPSSVAVDWLSKRIFDFTAQYGPVDFSLRGEEDPVAFEKDAIDIRMTYGKFFYPDFVTEEILTDTVFPACSPEFLQQHGPFDHPQQLLNTSLIHTDWGPSAATFPTWKNWFDDRGLSAGWHIESGLVTNYSKTAIDLAISGLGVVLCQGMLACAYLKDNSLVRISKYHLQLSQPYCLTIPNNRVGREIVMDFKSWLIDQMLDL